MSRSPEQKIADKLEDLFSDARILTNSWGFWIPNFVISRLTLSRDGIERVSAFADGINTVIEQKQIGLNPDIMLEYYKAKKEMVGGNGY